MSVAHLSSGYGLYACFPCRDGLEDGSDPTDHCGDHCVGRVADELPPLLEDYWPSCRCCGAALHLIAPLIRAAS